MQKNAEIQELSLAFHSEGISLSALDRVSFRLIPGKTLVLLGESGCGKSLTSLALMRLVPQTASYGKDSHIRIDNEDLLDLPEQNMRRLRGSKLAMIFQEPMTALNPVMTIGEQIAEVLLKDKKYSKEELQDAVISLLKEVEIPEPHIRIHQYPHQLSGGQKQRVVIAMALACKPEVLIADEPTTALDVTIQAQILNLLKRLQETHKMSLLLITHDLGVVRAMADRVCVMYAGQVVEHDSVEDFFATIGHPYVQQLLASLPSLSNREQQLSIIKGTVPSLDNLPSGCRFHPRCIYAFDRCAQEEPQLQSVGDRLIRCHLYPELKELPPLEKNKLLWDNSHKEAAPIFKVEDLKVYFEHKKHIFGRQTNSFKAVDGISFSLKKGKTLALVGESGCGKTTTSRALLRLIPVTSGTVLYGEQNVLTLEASSLREYRKKVQIIFQDPFSSMNPRMTVGDIIAEGMYAQGMKNKYIHHRQVQLLDLVNLPKASLHRYPHQFSGGQRQRICIARALATEPDIILCDEPTSALDVSVQAQILNLLKELQQEKGITYLFITHNMGVVSYIADEVLVMKNGVAIEYADTHTLFKNPQQSYTKQLMEAVLEC